VGIVIVIVKAVVPVVARSNMSIDVVFEEHGFLKSSTSFQRDAEITNDGQPRARVNRFHNGSLEHCRLKTRTVMVLREATISGVKPWSYNGSKLSRPGPRPAVIRAGAIDRAVEVDRLIVRVSLMMTRTRLQQWILVPELV